MLKTHNGIVIGLIINADIVEGNLGNCITIVTCVSCTITFRFYILHDFLTSLRAGRDAPKDHKHERENFLHICFLNS